MIGDTKIVEFEKYCKICKHEKLAETIEPCYECLENPINVDSHKPIKFEKK